ncbi:hypothetical protein BKA82DRAFT_4020848 [Pisolithus tinctorius]|nr:hypothetical protein BKA82DRAFT_4020848 [Pisolithus tinctorius]
MAKCSTGKHMQMIRHTPGHWVKQLQIKTWTTSEWLPHKEEFMKVLLDLEASPEPQNCARVTHQGLLFHRVQQWTGDFFEELALHMVRDQSMKSGDNHKAGHRQGLSSISGTAEQFVHQIFQVQVALVGPAQLMERNGKTWMICHPTCGDLLGQNISPGCISSQYIAANLLQVKLFPATFEKPSTTFTFAVLDDFMRDNLKCGTTGMNYYSKLCQIMSAMFPHLVPVPQVAASCMAMVTPETDEMEWHLGIHRHTQARCPADQVQLMDGCGYMVSDSEYQAYLQATPHVTEHRCFYPHSVVDFQKGERQLNMDYSLANALHYNMAGINKMIQMDSLSWKLAAVQVAADLVMQAFQMLDDRTAPTVHAIELELLENTLNVRIQHGIGSWLVWGLQLEEASITLWINCCHMEHLSSEQSAFITDGVVYFGVQHEVGVISPAKHGWGGSMDDPFGISGECTSDPNELNDSTDGSLTADAAYLVGSMSLPLPLNLGINQCIASGLDSIWDIKLKLWISQANDTLHGLQLALVDKQAKSYAMKMWAWDMIHTINSAVHKQATIYKQCQAAMVSLGATKDTLSRFQEMQKSHLTVSTVAISQNVHDHQGSQLPWFWSIDMPRDTESITWMLESKAAQDHWTEEQELLMAKSYI